MYFLFFIIIVFCCFLAIVHKNKSEKIFESQPSFKETCYLKDSLWYVPGINYDKPIFKMEKVEDGVVFGYFVGDSNEGKPHRQLLEHFNNIFCLYID